MAQKYRFKPLIYLAFLIPCACSSALHEAVRQNKIDEVRQLLDEGADVNSKENGRTALLEATRINDLPLAKLLIESSANIETSERRDGQTFASPLFYAASWGNMEMATLLKRAGAKVDARGWQEMTPLMEASRMGQVELARFLIANGAQVDATDLLGRTPLLWAAISGRATCVSLLLGAGADPDWKDLSGKGALAYAVQMNRRDIVETLKKGPQTEPEKKQPTDKSEKTK
ncbi:MAG: ankyrin repeat domain-containing protein [Spirochaetia bacterium]|nr:ankyrin repeat domain-containing protein [Spirochaetia bacterium]